MPPSAQTALPTLPSAGRRSRLGRLLLVALALSGLWALVQLLASRGAGPVAYDWDFQVLWKYRSLLLAGLGYTLLFTVVCIGLGLLVGLLAGLGRLSSEPPL